jgi:hypothetical protein
VVCEDGAQHVFLEGLDCSEGGVSGPALPLYLTCVTLAELPTSEGSSLWAAFALGPFFRALYESLLARNQQPAKLTYCAQRDIRDEVSILHTTIGPHTIAVKHIGQGLAVQSPFRMGCNTHRLHDWARSLRSGAG